jgi:hypothetical protein
MATIAQHITTLKRYLVIGPSDLSRKNNLFDIRTTEAESLDRRDLCLCDENGKLLWLPVQEVTIESVDGRAPSELLKTKESEPCH